MSTDRRTIGRHVQAQVSTVRAIVALERDRNLTQMAAGIAYYAFVSILPLLLLAVAAASFLGGPELAERVTEVLNQQLSAAGQSIVTEALTSTAGRGVASLVGVVTLAWTGMRFFRGLDRTFDEVYVDDVETSFLEQVRNAVVVALGVGTALVLVSAISVALAVLPANTPFLGVLGSLVLVVALTLAFLPIYYVLPPVEVTVREVLPGAFVAAVGWVLLQVGFRLYAANASRYAAYGLIGAVLLFVTWLYFASVVVLLGAAVNAVRRGVQEPHTVGSLGNPRPQDGQDGEA